MRLYAALEGALLVAEGSPGDWETDRRLTGHDLECVVAHSDDPDRVLCGTFESGLLRSDDGGESWNRVGESTMAEAVMSLAVNPHDPDEWWAGTEPSAVYRSTDGGATWTECEGLTDLSSESSWSFPPRPHTHHVRWITVDPDDPAHLYVSIEAGALVQTHDRGETWEDRVASARRDNHSLTTHPEEPDRAWAAAGDGYAETADGGETWRYPQEGLDHRYCWSVAVDPADPDTVLVSSARSARTAHRPTTAESFVYRRRDGDPWRRIDGDLPTGEGFLRAVLAAGPDGGEFYALTNRGLYRTTDAGDGWSRQSLQWEDAFENQTPSGLVVLPD
ncbi:MAG: WD40/YVTN/BNR-like repeat-containing protein [Haloferacaceae archaeon]